MLSKKPIRTLFFLLHFFFIIPNIKAQKTDKIYLSGKDFEHPVQWDFYCTGGNNSKVWSKINVPSQWELEGFGEYTYGRWYKELNQKEPSKEEGLYKYDFEIPLDYKNKTILIAFGGAMTDTEVKINGKTAGPIHQGGFYEFKYDISSLLKFGSKNILEVHVWKHSTNKSVNNAERRADWWLFGGIYRPVWLEVSPKAHIENIAVNPKMDGSITVDLNLQQVPKNTLLEVSLSGKNGENFPAFTFPLKAKNTKETITAKWENIKPWNPETPNLYNLKLVLKQNGAVLHEYDTKVGFRTLEFKKKDGIYVNGTKIIMKGINRHSFWPEGGRSTSKRISELDVQLIKDMNMNAVRGHYPPDDHFLQVCDSLGLFVLNELAGWQNSYDTEIGTKLVKEMVARDVNHPSVIIWDNGNEGGWNNEVDKVFAENDPQKRIVIHPWADFNGWDTHHYPTYLTGMHRFNSGENVFFPTEFMHGTYDNGHGAALQDFWNRYKESPLFAGGFMWAMLDEAVKRSDWKGEQKFDSKGSLAADGILGPHREKEGSYFSVKEIWAPIQFQPKQITDSFDGSFLITNDYLFSNLNSCKMEFRVLKSENDVLYSNKKAQEISRGKIEIPSIDPGETRKIKFDVPQNFFEGDILSITAFDQFNKEIYTWTWPIHKAAFYVSKFLAVQNTKAKASVTKTDSEITLKGNDVTVILNTVTGEIQKISNKTAVIPLTNGPRPIGMKAKLKDIQISQEAEKAVCIVNYSGGLSSIKWIMEADGRFKMELLALKNASGGEGFDGAFFEDKINSFGITFRFPEQEVTGIKWFGRGPYRVWKNRIKGTTYGFWEKEYNNTITGESFENLIYPEFKGYHANLLGASLKAGTSSFKVFSESDNLFLRLFTPDLPKNGFPGSSPQPDFPEGDISFMYEIPAMRDFKPLEQQGPQSQPTNIRIKKGDDGIKMDLWFDFRN
ncbi:glycoside hydrolase family 2 protein [Flavobacterium johnsoniae]|uniref:beta-galactosidase n=1 Tax=Flavobacterium johnsoniae (strain ATCC 17061 / DSM 2064 / JCM 8514 / BCRC 14874 / CCUG 350202 / NBRC 14942 / NCIMB 11054 / UW101) TaxID=376686 RepID=A5FC38_FLAJ1|nr:glycoside hydrolase family 2 TIM barrel-domain containing protein [Flavobacterium johnsoniae]ABQ07233.1 Candidate beta-glycosidase; Glycoside hydrolase family 2 [Flavobacterium johnsoniae UW101]OXE95856.1 beta-galactosidase [Flavobacterium johnsoniae UW101]WQG80929.1 glycoside hydrolase family 2 TIM barrel-domain containing protein [Flavobacterium johnsoniae UW101]SHL26386.1 Beta galactosidase small chain [Flavobacterium johnsoniae]